MTLWKRVINLGRPKKKFFEKKQNKDTLFIALFVALIIFMVEALLWAIEFATNSFLEAFGFESTTFARGLGLAIATLLLLYFTIDASKGVVD